MTCQIEFKPRAIKDLRALPTTTQRRTIRKIASLQNDLSGDVKKLTNFTPEYRWRVGDYRVLFEVEADQIVVYRVLHRNAAYQ